ncbi:MAG: 16S rRNA (adenine(1518)-N(6)/adenine(1519)-N(6))-dimethyltransferase RsmA [Acidimicrobiia bacterium]|nr:16S rRNA (adenine(1518)-N(6)/adenine(1519)-N(6))-dimethyltransferase RsmA [Acidimicrobiia bacterium]MBT8192024.1 16S rRNA (adenine(1518)-N(6)/adenine(1519)-N(6))-dimethyltransferase RsmA [Acidimicrobiia bacterium]NNF88247.1 16S rRNA (adenine(1518)-N(6)/adenine(1519)-N(6))-dimethyltransferase RsmA [Acidimicrobiia bacterium]NNL14365.1 16S rRNA (adenine(1518)-N(6)/adenine(1519)-N(6))-dimethyltransferase RsmA [Acidimicrobiia bacterium]NNL97739.1 16S rRNA (adenine(1518)-N(6)/adenine(1519)-N(6))-d
MRDGAQGRAEVIGLLRRHGVNPTKRLGQNFLVDPNTINKIVDFARVGPGDQVIEVGAGTGTLSRALAATGATIVAYEIDEHLRPVLDEVLASVGNVEVRFADAAQITLGEGSWTVVANLPYYLSSTLLLDWLQWGPQPERFVVMVQREVADRLTAGPGSRVYGIPSVIARLYGRPATAFRVPSTVFYPQPEVESAVVEIVRREPPPHARRAAALASVAFGQRRKMLRRSLAGALTDPEATLTEAGIDPQLRPEDVDVAGFLALAEVVDG